ncbi:MAG: oxygen-independent coproporphyrinogen III oxidase [Saprospiraceae bacterium]
MTNANLLEKYNIAAPRYTSYPTVPYWQTEKPQNALWIENVQNTFSKNPEISLYIHLPFCENLCTYCGCNKRITKNHKVETPYMNAVLKEWQMYLDILPSKPILKEIHLGGGTPTFFQAENLRTLLGQIIDSAIVPENHEFGLEVHPNTTSVYQLQVLRELGFDRVSIGVQDFDEEILKTIHRFQTTEQVRNLTIAAREMGYKSINYDLIFGLPKQKLHHILDTMNYLTEFKPDRIAFYSYAHVPWKSKSQRGYSEADLPTGEDKRELYDVGKAKLEELGYVEIGMDHFALKSDDLYKAFEAETMHRNFMGYTPFHTDLLIGLGTSAISDAWTAFAQNEKTVEAYQNRVEAGELPFFRGHLLNEEDVIVRQHILDLMCHFKTTWNEPNPILADAIIRLSPMIEDNLVEVSSNSIRVTKIGEPFVRNVCMALDTRLWANRPTSKLFSQVV